MIVGFRHKGLRGFWRTESTKGIQAAHTAKLKRILTALEGASSPGEMNLPGFRLHPLKGQRKGYWSVTVSGKMARDFLLSRTRCR